MQWLREPEKGQQTVQMLKNTNKCLAGLSYFLVCGLTISNCSTTVVVGRVADPDPVGLE